MCYGDWVRLGYLDWIGLRYWNTYGSWYGYWVWTADRYCVGFGDFNALGYRN